VQLQITLFFGVALVAGALIFIGDKIDRFCGSRHYWNWKIELLRKFAHAMTGVGMLCILVWVAMGITIGATFK